MPTLSERIEGGLVGLLVGDALGVPYEFKHPDDLPLEKDIEFEPPDWFPRSHATVRPGTWSDDGGQALCLLESLLHCRRLDPDDFGRRMVNWLDWGHLAVGGSVFDVGNITARALGKIRDGAPALEAAERHEESNGNGALMRVLPLALWHTGSDEELVRDARLSSLVTHGHARSQVCCALYCLWARELLQGSEAAWTAAVRSLRAVLVGDAEALHQLEGFIYPDSPARGTGSGYVVDTLRSARMVMERGSYEQVVKASVCLGHDTDTTAAVAGGIAGVRDGVQAIPERWRAALRGREMFEPLLARLVAHRTTTA
jgi:ADP-ribosyl-[dinitrogen reductase] hydrolase